MIGLATFTTIAALPTILAVSIFIGVLTTVTRNYRESEMVVWFSSGLSLLSWISPILTLAIPTTIIITGLTMFATPWAQRQMEDYRAKYEMRSDLSKITAGQFMEVEEGQRVFFAEDASEDQSTLGNLFLRALDPNWHSIVTAKTAVTEVEANGDRFLVLDKGQRYDLKPGTSEFRVSDFERFGMRLESKDSAQSAEQRRLELLKSRKARPTSMLIVDPEPEAKGQLFWRISIPIAALNLALLAIPLGAVNPRVGRSELLIAGLVAMLYMNLINISQGWINTGTIPFGIGVWVVHLLFGGLTAALLMQRLRVKAPKAPVQAVT